MADKESIPNEEVLNKESNGDDALFEEEGDNALVITGLGGRSSAKLNVDARKMTKAAGMGIEKSGISDALVGTIKCAGKVMQSTERVGPVLLWPLAIQVHLAHSACADAQTIERSG